MNASVARSRLSRNDRIEQILGVAHLLFAEHGYASVTIGRRARFPLI
jgi:hypothetical protein